MPYLRVITKKVIESRIISETRSKSRFYYALSEIGLRGDEILGSNGEGFKLYRATIQDLLKQLSIKNPQAEIRDTGYTYQDIEMLLNTALKLSPENDLYINFDWD